MRFKHWRDRLIPMEGANGDWCKGVLSKNTFNETGIGPLFSKVWSTQFLREWLSLSIPRTKMLLVRSIRWESCIRIGN